MAMIFRAVMVVAAALLFTVSPSFAQSTPDALVQQAVAALNSGKPGDFAALAAPGADPSWAKAYASEPNQMGRPWVGGTLDTPQGKWAVFSIDKMVEVDHDRIYRIAKDAGGQWRLAQYVDEDEPGRHWRIKRHLMRVTLQPDKRFMSGIDVLSVRRLTPGWPFIFDLGLGYTIREIDVSGVPAKYIRAGNLVRLLAPVTDTDTVLVKYDRAYTGTSPILSTVAPTDTLLYGDWLPVISYQPAASVIAIDTPVAWNSITQGDLTSVDSHTAGRITRVYTNSAPVSFIMLSAGKYVVSSRADPVPISTYMLQYDQARSDRGLSQIARAYPYYTDHFGPIPWKHYTLVSASALQGLAVEGYSFSVYSDALFPGACEHELGHSWWGGHVNNTYFGSYWNESLTTYSNDLVDAAFSTPLTAQLHRRSEMQSYSFAAGRGIDYALADAAMHPIGPGFTAINYDKGAMVCHMLQYEMGDDLFFRTLKRFAAKYAGQAAEWSDIDKIANQVAGRSMDWFFDQWTRRPGGIQFAWKNVDVHPEANGRWRVRATLTQANAEPYQTHVDVEAQAPGGSAIHRDKLWMPGASVDVDMLLPAKPARLVADPDDDLLRRLADSDRRLTPQGMYRDKQDLVIVYGSGGDPAYQQAMRSAADSAADYYKRLNKGFFADLASISVVADRDLTAAQRGASHIVLVGRPDANSVLAGIAGKLPVSFDPQGNPIVGKSIITDPGAVAVSFSRSPWNSQRLLTTWTARTPAAMSASFAGSIGGPSGHPASAWVIRDGDILAVSDAGAADSRTAML